MLKVSGLIDGSIDAVVNSGAAPNVVSGFYPHPQRGRIKSATVLSRGAAGLTFRPVQFEMPSVLQTHIFRKSGWVGSPYANELAVRTKRKESKSLAEVITAKPATIRRVQVR